MSKEYERVGTAYQVTGVPIYREKKSSAGAVVGWVIAIVLVLAVVS